MAHDLELLVLHHTASSRKTTFAQIREWHVNGNGWKDIGYHRGIRQPTARRQVEVEDLRPHDGDGRLESWEYGAHARGKNSLSLGLVLVGNFSQEPVPPLMYSAAVETLAAWCFAFALDPWHAVRGHREIASTATECPGLLLDCELLRWDVADRLAKLRDLAARLGA